MIENGTRKGISRIASNIICNHQDDMAYI